MTKFRIVSRRTDRIISETAPRFRKPGFPPVVVARWRCFAVPMVVRGGAGDAVAVRGSAVALR